MSREESAVCFMSRLSLWATRLPIYAVISTATAVHLVCPYRLRLRIRSLLEARRAISVGVGLCLEQANLRRHAFCHVAVLRAAVRIRLQRQQFCDEVEEGNGGLASI